MAPLACRKSCAPTPALLKGGHEVSGAIRNAIQESLIAMVQGLHERAVWPRSQVKMRESAKSSNSRPQGQGVAIWLCKRMRVRFRVPPPFIEISSLIRLGFFWNFSLKRIVASRAPFPQSWCFHPCRRISVLLFLWWSCERFVPNGLKKIDAGLQLGLAALQFGAHVAQPAQISQFGLGVRKSRLGRRGKIDGGAQSHAHRIGQQFFELAPSE